MVQKCLERGEQQHEQCHIALLGKLLEFLCQRRGNRDRDVRPTIALHGKSRTICGQLQDRLFAAQLALPVSQLAFTFLASIQRRCQIE